MNTIKLGVLAFIAPTVIWLATVASQCNLLNTAQCSHTAITDALTLTSIIQFIAFVLIASFGYVKIRKKSIAHKAEVKIVTALTAGYTFSALLQYILQGIYLDSTSLQVTNILLTLLFGLMFNFLVALLVVSITSKIYDSKNSFEV